MYQPNPPQNYQYVVPPAPLPTSTLAIISLISGFLGFGVIPGIGTVIALITGYMARQETRAYPPRASGDGMATAGIVMAYLQIALIVVSCCCFLLYMLLTAGLIASSNH